jgi:hypothetical protein
MGRGSGLFREIDEVYMRYEILLGPSLRHYIVAFKVSLFFVPDLGESFRAVATMPL